MLYRTIPIDKIKPNQAYQYMYTRKGNQVKIHIEEGLFAFEGYNNNPAGESVMYLTEVGTQDGLYDCTEDYGKGWGFRYVL